MILKTRQLVLRTINMNDVPFIHSLHSLKETDEFNTLGIPESQEETHNLVLSWISLMTEEPAKRYVFCIEKEQKEPIGLVGINMGKPRYQSAEIWYKLLPAFWNKGYTTEALTHILHFCFNELALHRVEAGCATENMASVKVLEKCGFTREGLKRKALPVRGQWLDNYHYGQLAEEFNSKPSSASLA